MPWIIGIVILFNQGETLGFYDTDKTTGDIYRNSNGHRFRAEYVLSISTIEWKKFFNLKISFLPSNEMLSRVRFIYQRPIYLLVYLFV